MNILAYKYRMRRKHYTMITELLSNTICKIGIYYTLYSKSQYCNRQKYITFFRENWQNYMLRLNSYLVTDKLLNCKLLISWLCIRLLIRSFSWLNVSDFCFTLSYFPFTIGYIHGSITNMKKLSRGRKKMENEHIRYLLETSFVRDKVK